MRFELLALVLLPFCRPVFSYDGTFVPFPTEVSNCWTYMGTNLSDEPFLMKWTIFSDSIHGTDTLFTVEVSYQSLLSSFIDEPESILIRSMEQDYYLLDTIIPPSELLSDTSSAEASFVQYTFNNNTYDSAMKIRYWSEAYGAGERQHLATRYFVDGIGLVEHRGGPKYPYSYHLSRWKTQFSPGGALHVRHHPGHFRSGDPAGDDTETPSPLFNVKGQILPGKVFNFTRFPPGHVYSRRLEQPVNVFWLPRTHGAQQ